MQAITAFQGGVRTHLVHNFGGDRSGEHHFENERFTAPVDGDIRPLVGHPLQIARIPCGNAR